MPRKESIYGLWFILNLSYDGQSTYITFRVSSTFVFVALRLLNLVRLDRRLSWLIGGWGMGVGRGCRTIAIRRRAVVQGAARSPVLELAVGASICPFTRKGDTLQERAAERMGGALV